LTQAHWRGWLAAIGATLVTAVLVIAEIDDAGLRHWWSGHALTTDTVSGLLVLLITFLVVNQVVKRRQIRDTSRAVAAQGAIIVGQAIRSANAVSAALDGSGHRDAASDEVRTYMIMLLVGAPVLIEGRVSRNLLEQAQHLGAEMTRVLLNLAKERGASGKQDARLNDAIAGLRSAAAPVIQQLNLDELIAAGADNGKNADSADNKPSAGQSPAPASAPDRPGGHS
jgi:hypothetical protein